MKILRKITFRKSIWIQIFLLIILFIPFVVDVLYSGIREPKWFVLFAWLVFLHPVVLFFVYFVKAFRNKKVDNLKKRMVRPLLMFLVVGVSFFAILAVQNSFVIGIHYPIGGGCGPGSEVCSIEETGKIAVAQLPHTQQLVKQYGAENIEISALYYKYIEDHEYIKRLLGDHFTNVDCIIPITWPDGEIIYIETLPDNYEHLDHHDAHDHATYNPVTPEEFAKILKDVSQEDIDTLYNNINDDQTHVRKVMKQYE